MSSNDFETRLGKLLPMLGSPSEPEAIAALRKINDLLRQNGKDWHWIVAGSLYAELPEGIRLVWDLYREQEREEAEARRQRPADAETEKSAAYVLSKGTANRMHPDNVAAFERAAAGGIINGTERYMILKSAALWRERDAVRIETERRQKRSDPFWLANWLLGANDPAKPFSQAERAFIDGVLSGSVQPSDVERLAVLERRLLRHLRKAAR